jgi:hypothetical protein
MTKAKTKWMPGKERPAASRLNDPKGLPRRSLTKRIYAETRNPPLASPIRQTAEGLDYRFLRSQPRVIGPGSLRKARPRQSDSNITRNQMALDIRTNSDHTNHALQKDTAAR